MTAETIPQPTRRGTTNANDRGSAADRRRRREWLVETWRADVTLAQPFRDGQVGETFKWDPRRPFPSPAVAFGWSYRWVATCRCYRCGTPLTVDTVTVDRIVPGCRGGTYRRGNIRPACGPCNSETGGGMRR